VRFRDRARPPLAPVLSPCPAYFSFSWDPCHLPALPEGDFASFNSLSPFASLPIRYSIAIVLTTQVGGWCFLLPAFLIAPFLPHRTISGICAERVSRVAFRFFPFYYPSSLPKKRGSPSFSYIPLQWIMFEKKSFVPVRHAVLDFDGIS